jgi:hypothetical protein
MAQYSIQLSNRDEPYTIEADNRVEAIRQAQAAAARFGANVLGVSAGVGATTPFQADEQSVRPSADDITRQVQTQTQTLPDTPVDSVLDDTKDKGPFETTDFGAAGDTGPGGLGALTGDMSGNMNAAYEAELRRLRIQALVSTWSDPFVLAAYIAEAGENKARQLMSEFGYSGPQIDALIASVNNITEESLESAFENASDEKKQELENSARAGSNDDGDDEVETEIGVSAANKLKDDDDPGIVERDDTDDGDNTVNGRKIIGIFPGGDYPQASLEEFLSQAGFQLPTDTEGRPLPLDAFETLPGFPAELLDPANLFIRVVEEREEFDDAGESIGTQVIERFIPNPAVEAALSVYGEQIGLRGNIAGEANDLVQAQISATGGVLPGPASQLSTEDYNALATNLRVIASTGGRLTADLQTQDGRTSIVESLSPIAKQDLTAEVLRQTGGRVGGYFDAQGSFVEGQTFDQFLEDQRQEANRQQVRDLERIQAQNAPQFFSSRLNAQQAEGARRRGLLQDITQIYQNPAQLAAIVQAGGGPLLQLQQELATQPTLPMAPGAQQPQTPVSQQTPTIGTRGTYLDPNFVPPSGLTLDEFIATLSPEQRITQPMNQQATPLQPATGTQIPPAEVNVGLPLVQGYNPRATEADFANLTPIQRQQALGSAAVFGKTPEEVQEDLASFTPGEQSSPLYGVGGTVVTTRR